LYFHAYFVLPFSSFGILDYLVSLLQQTKRYINSRQLAWPYHRIVHRIIRYTELDVPPPCPFASARLAVHEEELTLYLANLKA
jgi:hypothetical protein